MTKSWEDVREYACELYTDGFPLREVRERLKRDHNFTASERAFRMKLKQWKVKRNKCLGNCLEHMHAEREAETEPVLRTHFSQPQEMEVEHGPLSLGQPQNIAPQFLPPLIPYENGGHVASTTSPDRSPHGLYERLVADSSWSNVENTLTVADFAETFACILHYAAARPNPRILHSIIQFMQLQGVNIGIINETGRSALGVAIEADRLRNVELLLEADVSPLRNHQRPAPLLVALLCRADWTICDLLLKYGADPNAPLEFHQGWKTALELAAYDDQTQSVTEAENQLSKITILLRFCARYDPSEECGEWVYKCVMQHLKRYLLAACDPSLAFIGCFKISLENGFDSNFEFYPPLFDCSCKTLPRLVFFHLQHTALPRIFIDSIVLSRHGRVLIQDILEPCSSSIVRHRSLPPHALLEMLLGKDIKFSGYRNPISIALAISRKEDVIALVTTLLKFDGIDVHLSDLVYARPFNNLPRLDLPLRWRLAELLLDQDITLRLTTSGDDLSRKGLLSLLIHDIKSSYHKYCEPAFRVFLRNYLRESSFPWSSSDEHVEECLKCVIHVITKHIIGDISASDLTSEEKKRLVDALKMRRSFDLPDVEISTEVLLRCMRDDFEIDERGSHNNFHSQTRDFFCFVGACDHSECSKGLERKDERERNWHGLVHKNPDFTCHFCPDREHPRPDYLQR